MMKMRGYWVGKVPDKQVKDVELLKKLGFDYGEIFNKALATWLEKGVDACSKELIQKRIGDFAPELLKEGE